MIRPATPNDAAAIAAVHIESWRAAYSGLMPAGFLDAMNLADETARWTRGLANDPARGRPTFVETDPAGAVTGYITVGPDGDDPARGLVFLLYVAPGTWGSGAGARLLEAGLGGLRAAGFREAVLWVLEANTRARRFYEKSGWTLTDARTTSTYGDVTLSALCYSVTLDPPSLRPYT